MCESDRGEWGQPCPDCGGVLPSRQAPLTSWMAARPMAVAFGRISSRRWTESEREAHARVSARRATTATERQLEIARIVAKHGGNRNAAARELGITGPSVVTTLQRMKRMGLSVPESTR